MRVTTWTLGILAGVVIFATTVAFIPQAKDAWFKIFPRPEYKYLCVNSIMSSIPDIQKLKEEGWRADDVLTDSCGNLTIIFRRDR